MAYMEQGFFEQTGSLALGCRLRRLSDELMSDGAAIYKVAGVAFKPFWFPVFASLMENGPQGMSVLAEKLGVSHAAINQVAGELESAGLIRSDRDPRDGRARILTLTETGHRIEPELSQLWTHIRSAIDSAIDESGEDLLEGLSALERALAKRTFLQRFRDEWVRIEIEPFRAGDEGAFFELNAHWIRKYFTLEPADERQLRDPQQSILSHGGAIWVARHLRKQAVVGTCALTRHGEAWEVVKLSVSDEFQGLGLGRRLVDATLKGAEERGISKLILETNSALKPAIRLYESTGFQRKPFPYQSEYSRADVYMERETPQIVRGFQA